MLTLGVRYLNGVSAAADPYDRDTAEWPPHPGRVFMALAAAHFQTGGQASERAALEWLEMQDSPLMHAPNARTLKVVTQFVPVNPRLVDERKARSKEQRDGKKPPPPLQSAPGIIRSRHPRSFARARLEDETVWLMWPDVEPNELYADLLVAAEDSSDKKAQKIARARLRKEFGDGPPPRHRPHLSVSQGYAAPLPAAEPATHVQGTVLDPHFLPLRFERLDGPYRYLDLLDTLSVCQRWHEALCSQCKDLSPPVVSVISGRTPDGAPLDGPHLAFIPLAFVGFSHADGRLLGFAIALPQTISQEHRRGVFTALERVQEDGLKLGRLGSWRIVPVAAQRPPIGLLPETWTAYPDGSTHWATVTPIAFDQHPKAKDNAGYQSEVAGMIRLACQRIGLPEPREIVATPVSAHLGVPPAPTFPRLLRKDGSERRHSHAILIFSELVRGPMLLGAGRYRGYGLCRPIGPDE